MWSSNMFVRKSEIIAVSGQNRALAGYTNWIVRRGTGNVHLASQPTINGENVSSDIPGG